MLYTLKNDQLTVTISDIGAETVSVRRGDCEYIWQGNPAYWDGKAPLMFPVCSRMFEDKYTYLGKEYSMPFHGFARDSKFLVESASERKIVLSLTESADTLECYPFAFRFTVTYALDESTLYSEVRIENTGDSVLPATFGAHPGFNVPLDVGSYEDWYIEFSEECTPNELEYSESLYNTGRKYAYPIKDGRIIELCHSLFDVDSIFFDSIAPKVTLKSKKSERSVTLSYHGFPYLGIWHQPQTDAPYLCIEPWYGMSGYEYEIIDIMKKPDMFHILPRKQKNITYSITFI